jgi:hypothetical protein
MRDTTLILGAILCATSITWLTGCGGGGGVDGAPSSAAASGGTSAGTGGGSGSSGGSGGSGPACTPEGPFDGAPVVSPPGAWTWVGVPEAKCRDGSPTGFGIRRNPASDKLLIYLEGGGACFNGTTCGISPGSFNELTFNGWATVGGVAGIFDTNSPGNPLKDWNAVYIPYCSGDIHAGNRTGVDIEGLTSPKNQSFVGFANIGHFLKRIIPTFPDASKVLLTGISAGGFGAAYNYDRVAQAFCPTPVILIDDSGPPMADAYLAPCLQDHWRTLWNLDQTLPADCADCSPPGGGGIIRYVSFLAGKYPDSRLGLVSSTQDAVISLFFGYGQNDCANLNGVAAPVPGPVYAEGLLDLRDHYLNNPPSWGTYFVNSTTHTYLIGPGFYTTASAGWPLTAWVNDLVNDGPANDIGP